MIDFENVMKSCEIRYQLLINHISDVLVEKNLTRTFTYLISQVYDTFRYNPEELTSSKLYDFENRNLKGSNRSIIS